ncbi:hypothetical protein CRENBAI_017444 [Crenichthys baileyi]|uniref:Uncharacterized protein n=1 Tax=Crenichthys baileyi TaxID=28760 RepID=A0AAV9R7I1_9TELE
MVRAKRVNRQAEEKRDACQDDEQATASSTSSSEIPIGILIITYSTDDDDEEPTSTATTTVENQTSVRPRGTSILCETPGIVYQHSPRQLNAPKKSTYYLCKVQRPPLDTLQEEWSLEPYGLKGSWGYIFMYEIGELCLYQLDQDEDPPPSYDIYLRGDNSKLTDTENQILRMSEATPYRDLYNHQAEIHFSPEHDESFNIGPYHPPSPDLFFSPSTSTSSFSETHFSPASPTGYNMKMYQPSSPDLYSLSSLFMAESVDAIFQ